MKFQSTITAVLGGTNTGKTHYAVERMLARSSGVIGLPLRLLAREVYERAVREKGEAACALVTGEEKIVPPHARYIICTAEAMPMDDIRAGKFASVVIDEVQMFAHQERGHVFTDRMLHARGTEETLLLGANTARPLIEARVPDARFMTRERFSVLSYAGHTKLSRLPKRTVVVAFSAGEVYALAEMMRRYYGGAALVMGSLSPRTRNAQAALYQSGEVDYMVATDAIGMGLNLDVDHVAFASLRKFDGERRRYLTASETAQIAGRAGRFRNDGSFGTTGSCLPLDHDMVARIENNAFMPEKYAQWRSTDLDFSGLEALHQSLATPPKLKGLRRIAPAADEVALARLCTAHDIEDYINGPNDVQLLWEVCQIPDFPDLGPEAHARLLDDIHTQLRENAGKLPPYYVERNISRLDETGGSVEMLSARLSNIRTWSYVAHKTKWHFSDKDWIKPAQAVENRLSDALHNKLVDRFIDYRTSTLLRGIGNDNYMHASVTTDGQVVCDGQTLGQLHGLVFTQAKTGSELEEKTINQAAHKVLGPEIDRRLTQIAGAGQGDIKLSDSGEFLWNGSPIGKVAVGDTLLKPKVELLCGDLGSAVLRDAAHGRLADFIRLEIEQKLGSIITLRDFAQSPSSFKDARALAHVMFENHGMLDTRIHHKLIADTGYTARGHICGLGGAFGFRYAFMRDLMKPKPARLLSILYGYAWGGDADGAGRKNPFFPANGQTSMPSIEGYSEGVLNKAGYTKRGGRIIRFDIFNRLSDLLFRARKESQDGNFTVKMEMLDILGCSFEDFEKILTALGYHKNERQLTDAEAARHKEYVLTYFARRDAIKKARELGTLKLEDFPELTPPPALAEPDIENQDSVPKGRQVKPLKDRVAKPQEDDDGNPVFETHVEFWAYSKVAKTGGRYRPSKHGSNDPERRKSQPQDMQQAGRHKKRRKPVSSSRSNGKGQGRSPVPSSSSSPFDALAAMKFEIAAPKAKKQQSKPKSKVKAKPRTKNEDKKP